uniref:Ion transport domain-containing protein n=1 Tax=Arcella intermedia TaxID=1963864 RepID=A0A6B2L9T1_9EUKA
MSKGLKFSRLAFLYQVFLNGVIWLSVVNFLISSLPRFWESDLLELEIIEKTSVGIFTIDYFGRFATTRPGTRWIWFKNPMHLFDLAVIVPFYIEIILKHGTDFNPADDSILVVIRALRLFQMFRTVKIARYSSLIPVFMKALALSKDGFVLFTFTISIFMIVVSAILFYGEQIEMDFDYHHRVWVYPNGDFSPFQSIPGAFWWFMATITTVGYGDSYPRSQVGKAIAAITMVCGLFVLAVPVAVFGSNFSAVWDERAERNREEKRKRRKKKYKQMTDVEMMENLEELLKNLSTRLTAQQEITEKLLKDEKEIFDVVYYMKKHNIS